MSIELSKVVLVYEQGQAILQAKAELMSISSFNNFAHFHRQGQCDEEFELIPLLVEAALDKIIKTWVKKLGQYQQYQSRHEKFALLLEERANNLKNNTEMLSKETQLITDLQQLIKGWQEKEDPISYYDIKKRKKFKEEIVTTLEEIKDSSTKTEESMAPLYAHKLEKQVKQTITNLHYQQTEIDKDMIDFTATIHNSIGEVIQGYGRNVQEIQPPTELSDLRSSFYTENRQILDKQKKLSDKNFNKYFQSLSGILKRYNMFWNSYTRKINGLLETIALLKDRFQQTKNAFSETENKIYKLLEDVPDSIGSIFRVKVIFEMIKIFVKTFEIIKFLDKFKQKIQAYSESVLKVEAQARAYSEDLVKQINARKKDFYEYALHDKKFLEESAKAEKAASLQLLQLFKDFLIECYNMLRQMRKFYNKQDQFYEFETYRIGQMVNSLIISERVTENEEIITEDSKFKGSRLSTIHTNRKRQKKEKNDKIKKIEQFLENIVIFNSEKITSYSETYSCALGPKFLLHGKIKIYAEGIFYQSIFNKRNLFFGKTSLFIPSSDIVEIDERNTLVIFPDAIEIRTKKGLIFFHALGSRKMIFNSIIEAYFPENKEEGDFATQIDFKQRLEPEKILTSEEMMKIEEPLESVISQSTFKGVALNKFFRRYYSDDKFEIRGQTYQNYKCYFLQQIEAINPQSSPLIPEPPSYFCYKNEQSPDNSPQTSERVATYRKKIPKIPFVSSGGDGFCEETQVYHWISPSLFYIETTSVVKGFSLTEGMEILLKTVVKQVKDDVKVTESTSLRFSTNSSTNALLKTPAISNLKDACIKNRQIITKYEKGKKTQGGRKTGHQNNEQVEILRQKVQILESQNIKLKKQRKYMLIGFVILYLLSLLAVRYI